MRNKIKCENFKQTSVTVVEVLTFLLERKNTSFRKKIRLFALKSHRESDGFFQLS